MWSFLIFLWSATLSVLAVGAAVVAILFRNRIAQMEVEVAQSRDELSAASRRIAEIGRQHTADMAKMQVALESSKNEQRRVLSALGSTVEVLF